MDGINFEEPKKKSNKILIIVILLLVIALLFLVGYILIDKEIIKTGQEKKVVEQQTAISNESKEINLEVTDPTVQNLIDDLSLGTVPCGIWNYYTDEKVVANDLSNELVFDMVIRQLIADNNKTFAEGDTISKAEVDNKIKKLFGVNYNFTHKTYEMCPSFTYDDTTKTYTAGKPACGGACGAYNEKKIAKAIQIDDELDIYVKVIFIDNQTYPVKYYSDYSKTKEISNIGLDSNNMPNITDEHIAQGTLYKLVFEKEADNYVFRYSQPEK